MDRAMPSRRPITAYFELDEPVDAVVGDDAGHSAPAAFDLDDGWMDLSDPERPFELGFEVTARPAMRKAPTA